MSPTLSSPLLGSKASREYSTEAETYLQLWLTSSRHLSPAEAETIQRLTNNYSETRTLSSTNSCEGSKGKHFMVFQSPICSKIWIFQRNKFWFFLEYLYWWGQSFPPLVISLFIFFTFFYAQFKSRQGYSAEEDLAVKVHMELFYPQSILKNLEEDRNIDILPSKVIHERGCWSQAELDFSPVPAKLANQPSPRQSGFWCHAYAGCFHGWLVWLGIKRAWRRCGLLWVLGGRGPPPPSTQLSSIAATVVGHHSHGGGRAWGPLGQRSWAPYHPCWCRYCSAPVPAGHDLNRMATKLQRNQNLPTGPLPPSGAVTMCFQKILLILLIKMMFTYNSNCTALIWKGF